MSSNKKVYLLKDKEGNKKIGCSKSPKKRMKDLSTSHPYGGLELIGFITCGDLPEKWLNTLGIDSEMELEKELHRRHEEYKIHGEWFYFPKEISLHIDNLFINGCPDDEIPLSYAYKKDNIVIDNLLQEAQSKFKRSDFFKPIGHRIIFKIGKHKGQSLERVREEEFDYFANYMVNADLNSNIDRLIASMVVDGFSKRTICEAIIAPYTSPNNDLSKQLNKVTKLENVGNIW